MSRSCDVVILSPFSVDVLSDSEGGWVEPIEWLIYHQVSYFHLKPVLGDMSPNKVNYDMSSM